MGSTWGTSKEKRKPHLKPREKRISHLTNILTLLQNQELELLVPGQLGAEPEMPQQVVLYQGHIEDFSTISINQLISLHKKTRIKKDVKVHSNTFFGLVTRDNVMFSSRFCTLV